MPTSKRKKPVKRAVSRPVRKQAAKRNTKSVAISKPISLLAHAVDDLRMVAHVHQIEDSYDAILAYAVNSELFQKEQDNVSRVNYMSLMSKIRRIWTLALVEIPEPEAVMSPDLA